jgi:hypothetical protein
MMQQRAQHTSDDRSLGELFSELTHELTTLVRQETALARSEMSQKVREVGKDLAFLAAGGAVAYAGFLALLAAVIIGLGQLGVWWWLSALLVGVVVTGIGYALVQKGLTALKQVEPAPQQTIASLKEDKEWAKEQVR